MTDSQEKLFIKAKILVDLPELVEGVKSKT